MKAYLVLAAALLISVPCKAQNFKLATTEPLRSNQEELKVKGRQGLLIKQKLTIGEGQYYTTKVKRSAIRRWSAGTGLTNLIWTEHAEGKQSINFRLTNGKDTSDVHCVSNVETDDLIIGANPDWAPNQVTSILRIGTDDQRNNFSVAIYMPGEDQPWELFLDNTAAQLRRKSYTGYVDRGKDYYMIVPVWQIEKKNGNIVDLPFGSTGFEIQTKDGVAIAAVSLVNNGLVFMDKRLDDKTKFLVANISAALLLQSDISGD
jgi:hypothetical protein